MYCDPGRLPDRCGDRPCPTPTTVATRTPATIDGRASGSSTCRSSSRGRPSLLPRPLESTASMPRMHHSSTAPSARYCRGRDGERGGRRPPPMSGTGSRKPNIARLGDGLHDVGDPLQTATRGAGGRAAKMPRGTPIAAAIAGRSYEEHVLRRTAWRAPAGARARSGRQPSCGCRLRVACGSGVTVSMKRCTRGSHPKAPAAFRTRSAARRR